MVLLAGIAVTDTDALKLVATLTARGGPDAIAAAGRIGHGIESDHDNVEFTPAMRDTILSVLKLPPDGLLELRTALARDSANQHPR